MKRIHLSSLGLSLLLAGPALLAGCSSDSVDGEKETCRGAKCDELDGDDTPLVTPCDSALFDRSGRGFLPERLGEDALVEHVYMDAADGCPVTAREIMEVLKRNDTDGCSGNEGLITQVVSEQAQLNDSSQGASYRTITSRQCGDREEFGLLFSLFGFADHPSLAAAGLDPAGDNFPDGIEIIAFDEANGVFNFYKEVGGKMGFFGSSTDYVAQGPGGPNLTDVRGCANCHPGGGLNMKELENPWLHWEELPDAGFTDFERTSPGAEALVENRADFFGEQSDGPSLEQLIIKPGNQRWNARRIPFVNENSSVAELLKPLFCPVQLQIGAAFNARRVNHNFLIDQGLLSSLDLSAGRIDTEEEDYNAVLGIIGSRVAGSTKSDVRLPMAFVGRAHEDIDYVEQLIEADIIDRNLANDILMVDFTRQVFSDERCDLLEFAPDIATADRNPESIRDGFLANLSGAADDTAAGQLRAHLQSNADGEAFNHAAIVQNFIDACEDREFTDQFASTDSALTSLLGASEFVIDSLKLRSLGRKMAMRDGVLDNAEGSAQHRFEVFEFPDTLPEDDINITSSADAANPLQVHPEARFHPTDCSLADEFVPVAAPASGGGGGGVCPGECLEFVNGASCQCDPDCVNFGNCCDGFEDLLDACPGDIGEFVNGAACQCDDMCSQFGNCCTGFEPICEP